LEKRKEILRNLIKIQNINKALVPSIIWIEVLCIICTFFYVLNNNSIFIYFIVSSIIIASVFKSKGKIVESKFRITGMLLVFINYIQTLTFVILYYNISNNIELESLLKNILFDYKVILSILVGLLLAYLLSCKKVDFTLIKNELNILEKRGNNTPKKNLSGTHSKELFKKGYSSTHKDKYSTKKRGLKF
jgi:hypothetical protein